MYNVKGMCMWLCSLVVAAFALTFCMQFFAILLHCILRHSRAWPLLLLMLHLLTPTLSKCWQRHKRLQILESGAKNKLLGNSSSFWCCLACWILPVVWFLLLCFLIFSLVFIQPFLPSSSSHYHPYSPSASCMVELTAQWLSQNISLAMSMLYATLRFAEEEVKEQYRSVVLTFT